MNENTLEEVCFDWLNEIGYDCLYGDDISPGGDHEDRESYHDVILPSRLKSALTNLNPEATASELNEAFNTLNSYASQSLIDGNKKIYDWLRNGVPVERKYQDGTNGIAKIKVLSLTGNNDLAAVRQFTVLGDKPRRPDIVIFVNGIPLVIIELKNPTDIKTDIESAFNQIQNYKADIPKLFYF